MKWIPSNERHFSKEMKENVGSYFVYKNNGHRTTCTRSEMCEISTGNPTPFSFGIPTVLYERMNMK